MRKVFLLATIISFILAANYSVYACERDCSSSCKRAASESAAPTSSESKPDQVEFANVYAVDEEGNNYAVCPVTGSAFKVSEENSYSIVEGKGYYHCCAGCEKPFQANPDKHMSSMKKKMAEAKKSFEKGHRPGLPRM